LTENHKLYPLLNKDLTALEKIQEMENFGHWELDIKTGKLQWSKQIYKIFRLSPEKFDPTYEKFLSVIHPEDRDMVQNAYENSLKNKTPYKIEHRLLFDNDITVYVSEKCETQFDEKGSPVKSIGTVLDITERVISNQKLKESEEKFKAYTNQSSEGVTVADMEGNYVFVNPAFCKMSGYTEEELLKLTVFDMKAVNQCHSSF
jgi:PAS domain-containing protein